MLLFSQFPAGDEVLVTVSTFVTVSTPMSGKVVTVTVWVTVSTISPEGLRGVVVTVTVTVVETFPETLVELLWVWVCPEGGGGGGEDFASTEVVEPVVVDPSGRVVEVSTRVTICVELSVLVVVTMTVLNKFPVWSPLTSVLTTVTVTSPTDVCCELWLFSTTVEISVVSVGGGGGGGGRGEGGSPGSEGGGDEVPLDPLHWVEENGCSLL